MLPVLQNVPTAETGEHSGAAFAPPTLPPLPPPPPPPPPSDRMSANTGGPRLESQTPDASSSHPAGGSGQHLKGSIFSKKVSTRSAHPHP